MARALIATIRIYIGCILKGNSPNLVDNPADGECSARLIAPEVFHQEQLDWHTAQNKFI
jgi:hypothetical protein